MSLKPLNLKLTLLFSGLFTLFAALLFVFAYLLLHSSIRQDEFEEMRSRLLQLWAAYQTGSLASLEEELNLARQFPEERQFMLRVGGPRNETLLLYQPEYWKSYDLSLLERLDVPPEGGLLRLRARGSEERLEILSLRLPDGILLQVGLSSRGRDRALARFRRTFLPVGLSLLVLGFAGGAFFSSRLLRPVKHLVGAVRSVIDTGDMKTRLPTRGTGDELDELVRLFNRMLQKIDALVRAMRESLDNVAHDLRTPLTRLRNTVESALRHPRSEADRSSALGACIEETDRILSMLTHLMDISEAETGVMRLERWPADLTALVRDVLELYQYAAEEKGIGLRPELSGELVAAVDPGRFRQIVANLLDNALKYTPSGGTVTVRVFREAAIEPSGSIEPFGFGDGRAVVSVEDTGIGISDEELPRIWDRLYRGDRSRSLPGLGLGLALVRAVAEAHGGSVQAASRAEGGSVFTVRLPLAGSEQKAPGVS